MAEQVEHMCKANKTEPAASEWAFPIFIVPKHKGSKRMCIDYRKLITVTIRDTYPHLRMNERSKILSAETSFSALEAKWKFS